MLLHIQSSFDSYRMPFFLRFFHSIVHSTNSLLIVSVLKSNGMTPFDCDPAIPFMVCAHIPYMSNFRTGTILIFFFLSSTQRTESLVTPFHNNLGCVLWIQWNSMNTCNESSKSKITWKEPEKELITQN